MGEIIKFLIYAISMCAIELVINSLYNRKSITDNAGRNEFHYVLKIPGALKYTCMAFFTRMSSPRQKIYNFFCSFSGSFIAAHSCFKWVFTVILPFRIP